MKLISNTSFGKLCKSKENEFSRRIDYLDWFERVRTNFDKFLKQNLNLGMLIPCDEDGNVLEKPENYIEGYDEVYNDEIYNYLRAKEKVLFEGFEVEGNKLCYSGFYFGVIDEISNGIVENILNELPENEMPQLTESAIKQIGL